MKKIILIILLCILLLEGVALATLSYDETYYMQRRSYVGTGSSVTDPLYLFMAESIGYLEGTTAIVNIWFDPTDTIPDANEGRLYYHESDESLKLRTSNAWVDIDVSGASSLGTAYAIGSAITVNTDAITLTTTDAANNVILALVHGETGNFSAMTITNASAFPAIQITGSSTGADITGTSATWSVATTGVATLVGATIGNSDLTFTEPSSNDVYLLADTDSQLTIGGTSKEDINLNFHTADTLTISSSTGMDKVDWGGVDEHSGLLSITFDPAVAGLITIAGTGNDDDISITQTGTTDVSVALVSAGSVSDAIHIESSDAVGGILIDSSDILDIDAVDDITIDTTDGTYTLTIAGSSDGDYVCTVADDFSTIVVGSLLFKNTEASSDITINSVLGSIIIEGEENAANAVLITADGGTTSGLKLHNDTGTGDESIFLSADVGGITINAASGSIDIEAVSSDGGDLLLSAGDVMTFTSVDTKIFDGAATETWVIEGTANGYEAKIVFIDPTADVTYNVPVVATSTVSFMLSSLATNAPEIANSVTGGTNQLIFEGSSADAYETILTATNATSDDNTVTIPDGGNGTLLVPTYLAYTASGNIDADECWGGVLTNAGASDDIVLNLPTAVAGMRVTFTLIVASDVDLNAFAGDTIAVLTDTAGDQISSAATAGNSITLHAVDANTWVPISIDGAWADAN